MIATFPIGDPTVVGWTTFALYLLASACSLRCGLSDGNFENDDENGQIWRVHAGVLFLLGLNKQLDLQTPLIKFGKRLALSLGWYEYRSVIEISFFVALAVVLGLVVMRHAKIARSFARKHPLAASGDVLIGAYILTRTIYMDHLDGIMGFSLENVRGLWFGEMLGLILLISAAIHARPFRKSFTEVN